METLWKYVLQRDTEQNGTGEQSTRHTTRRSAANGRYEIENIKTNAAKGERDFVFYTREETGEVNANARARADGICVLCESVCVRA